MSATLAKVTSEVLELPAHERLALADFILKHDGNALAHDEPMSPVEEAWDTEIRRRMAAYDRGEVQGIPLEEVMAEMDGLLAAKKQAR